MCLESADGGLSASPRNIICNCETAEVARTSCVALANAVTRPRSSRPVAVLTCIAITNDGTDI